jgi:AcrR family transcriptional regulator
MATATSRKHGPYHHGNLKEALITVGIELAREGGPEAVSIREAARRVGVSANAAYRHFENLDGLTADVASRARGLLAQQMLAELEALPRRRSPADRARDRLRATGRGYIRFALGSPGLFRCSFADVSQPEPEPSPGTLLQQALTECVEAGAFSAARIEITAAAAWAIVHGYAELALRGLLGDGDLETLGDEVLKVFQRGLGAG